jgi:ABC-type multidrug transport system fused ATPase/permease subunit
MICIYNILNPPFYSSLVIAHRLSTIRHANSICVIHKGKVAERGTFDELVGKENGIFRQLVQLQTREFRK